MNRLQRAVELFKKKYMPWTRPVDQDRGLYEMI
jgi:hypothetical protein